MAPLSRRRQANGQAAGEIAAKVRLAGSPVAANPVGSVAVGEHRDLEQLGAWSGTEGVEALPESAFEFVEHHFSGDYAPVLTTGTSGARRTRRIVSMYANGKGDGLTPGAPKPRG